MFRAIPCGRCFNARVAISSPRKRDRANVGVSKLRLLNADKLHKLDETLVIQDDDKPLAVVLSYEQFLAMQKERNRILASLETFFNDDDRTALVAALMAANKGDTKPDSEVRGKKEKGGQKRPKED